MNKLALFLILLSAGHTYSGKLKDVSKVVKAAYKIVVADISRPKYSKVPFMLGANETTIEDRPFQVSFVVSDSFFCGGFIVSEDYIMTSAHCIRGGVSDIVLRAGSVSWSQGTVIPLAEVWVHPQYNVPQYDNDVAVFKTAEKIVFSDTIQAIPLASEGREMVADSEIEVSGWGLTENSTMPNGLLMASMRVVEHARCQELYPSELTSSEFCAGDVASGEQGTCHGDSGGAATQDGVAVGIVAFARACGQPNAPTVFTDIAAKPIRDFIKEKTGL